MEFMRMPVPQRSTTYGGSTYLPFTKTRPAENCFPRVTPSAFAEAHGISSNAHAAADATAIAAINVILPYMP